MKSKRDSASHSEPLPSTSSRQTSSYLRTLRVLALIRPHLGLFVFGMAALIVGSAVNLILPEVARRLVQAQQGFLFEHPWQVAIGLSLLFLVQAISFYFRSYLFGILGQRVVADIRERLYATIVGQGVPFFDIQPVGALVSRLSADTALLQDAVSIKLSVFLRYALQVLIGIGLMVYFSARLSLAILLALPILIGISLILARRLRFFSRLQQSELAAATAIAEETFTEQRIVKAFNRESFEVDRFKSSNQRVFAAGAGRTRVSAFFQSFVSLLMNLALVGIALYGVLLIYSTHLSVGDLTAFFLYAVIVAVSFSFVAGGISDFVQALGGSDRIFEILELPRSSTNEGKTIPPSGAVEVQFVDVSFSYPTRPDQPALRDLSFTLPAGKKVALVGASGSGKSSIINLILKFYSPTSGQITFGGFDLEQLSPVTLRDRITLVPQEPHLFSLSIAENLRYAKPDATEAELEEVCRKAHIWDFIRTLPDGLQTQVGSAGSQLSAGQRQRIAIARAMLRNSDLLILDEATSALDSENEFAIQQSLALLMKGRTSLVIAHRLSTIKDADLVIVLDGGKIVEMGTHELLSAKPGVYRQLVERQMIQVG